MTSGRILVIDDEPQIRRVLRTTLAAEGYEVHDARSGEEGLEKVRDVHVDLVLLDMNMPGLGGLEACREIRSRSEVGIIMLTVRDDEKDKIAALDAGADDYVTKPFSSPELMARVRSALRRIPPDPSTGVLSLDTVEVDFGTRRVRRDGKHTRLTPKELDVLRHLALHPNTPVTHARLLQAVWGPDYGDEVEYLRVIVNQLRKKIELDPGHPRYLVTEPWVGYRLVVPTSSGVLPEP